jgi:hypothetical protein
MVSMETDISKPWYIREDDFDYMARSSRCPDVEIPAQCKIRLVKDSKRCINRLASIVKLDSCWRRIYNNDWRDWFLDENDKDKSQYKKIPNIPKYCSEEYGLVVNKYKKIKIKSGTKFYDYGLIVMMLTGSKVGRVKSFYMTSPFIKVCDFNNIPKLRKLKEPFKYVKGNLCLQDLNITKLSKDIRNEYGIEEEARRRFINILHENLVRLEYVK